jgi:hypothetical protein
VLDAQPERAPPAAPRSHGQALQNYSSAPDPPDRNHTSSPAQNSPQTAAQMGATSAELVKYATSGDISGDRDLAVGYAGVVVC